MPLCVIWLDGLPEKAFSDTENGPENGSFSDGAQRWWWRVTSVARAIFCVGKWAKDRVGLR